MFDNLYVPKFLKPPLISTLGPMILREEAIYRNYQSFTQNQRNIKILKEPLHEDDSLIMTLESIEGYPKLCVKTYPRTQYGRGTENGQNALKLFQNRSGMECLQKNKLIPPYHLVCSNSSGDENFMYCVYDYVPGKRLTERLISIAQNENKQDRKILVSELDEDVKKFSEQLSNLGLQCGGLWTQDKRASDNIIVDPEGHWWITDLDAIGTFDGEMTYYSLITMSYLQIYHTILERS